MSLKMSSKPFKKPFKKLAPTLAAAAAVALTAAPALADAPYTVSFTGTNPITATAKGDTILTANGNQFVCSNSSVTATVNPGTYSTSPANNVATITAATWTTCTFAGLFPVSVTVTSPSWHLNIVDPNSQTSGLTDVIGGNISNISGITVDMNIFGSHCTYNLSGSLPITFREDDGKGGQEIDIAAGSGLSVGSPSAACAGQVNDGDPATFDGQYNWSGQVVNVS